MSLRLYRSFATELMKIAGDLADSDIRKLLAERRGEEYLEGGGLTQNSIIGDSFATPSTALQKTANYRSYSPPSTYNVRGKKPTGEGSTYETGSNLASSALKGGMTGAGVYALQHNMRHGFSEKAQKMNPKHLGGAVALGGGIALADRALRHRAAKKKLMEKQAMIGANPGASFGSPGMALRASQRTGSIEGGIRKGPQLKGPLRLGTKFAIH